MLMDAGAHDPWQSPPGNSWWVKSMNQSSVGPPRHMKQTSLLQSTWALMSETQLRTANDTQTPQQSTEQLTYEKIWRFACVWLGQARATAEKHGECQRTCYSQGIPSTRCHVTNLKVESSPSLCLFGPKAATDEMQAMHHYASELHQEVSAESLATAARACIQALVDCPGSSPFSESYC